MVLKGEMAMKDWTKEVVQVRVARPTNQLAAIERFYCEGVGLEKIGSFSEYQGYDGIMIGTAKC